MSLSKNSMILTAFIVVSFFSNCTTAEHDGDDSENGTIEEPDYFEKPPLYQYDSDEFFYRFGLRESGQNPFEDGTSAVNVARDPIVQTKRGRALWLYEDDPFVIDIGYQSYGENELGEVFRYDVMVLLDYEPVEFTIQEFHDEESMPSTDDLMENSEFEKTQGIEIEMNAGFQAFSLAVPKDSFPEKAAYDMRVVALPRVEPDDDVFWVDRVQHRLSRNFSVFYGSTEVREQELPKVYEKELIVPSMVENSLIGWTNPQIFVRPPEYLYDLDDNSQDDIRLGQAFEVDESNPEVHALARHRAPSGEEDRPMVVAFDGTEVLDEPFGVVEIPEQRNFLEEDPDPYVVKMPLELDIQSSEEPHALRVMRFDHPLERRTYDIDENAGQQLYQPSPPLFLQRAED